MNIKHLTLAEILFIAILGTAMGIAWWAYTFLYNFISPPLKVFGLSGLLSGFWYMGGIFFGYIIRKPGSALLGEVFAASIQGMISQWGLLSLAAGFAQGITVELLFLALNYRRFDKWTIMLAGMFAAVGGYILSYYYYGYNLFSLKFNVINLTCHLIAGALVGGLFTKFLADYLLKAGVLKQFKISRNE